MSKPIDVLFNSLLELEEVIHETKTALRGANPNILVRISSYEDILNKQRDWATSLCDSYESRDWEEVSRHVKIINGLSSMIYDDALEILKTYE